MHDPAAQTHVPSSGGSVTTSRRCTQLIPPEPADSSNAPARRSEITWRQLPCRGFGGLRCRYEQHKLHPSCQRPRVHFLRTPTFSSTLCVPIVQEYDVGRPKQVMGESMPVNAPVGQYRKRCGDECCVRNAYNLSEQFPSETSQRSLPMASRAAAYIPKFQQGSSHIRVDPPRGLAWRYRSRFHRSVPCCSWTPLTFGGLLP